MPSNEAHLKIRLEFKVIANDNAPMSHYLVTGGCGFIGSHLTELLLSKGHKVRIIDDLSSGKRSNVPPEAEIIEDTILNPKAVTRSLQGIDACFHLAAIPSVTAGKEQWLSTHQTNLTGTICVFEEASCHTVPVVYASSAAVYGDAKTLPIKETLPAQPLTAYGLDKYCCELNAALAGKVFALPTFGLRFFNVYGPRQDPKSPYSGVISKFAEQIKNKKPITIFDDGKQTRDFIFVKDVASCVFNSLKHVSPNAPVSNVGTGTSVTINNLAEEMLKISNVQLPVNYGPKQEGQLRHSLSDTTNIKKYFPDLKPTPLSEGLAVTINTTFP